MVQVILPASMLDERKVDEHFAPQRDAVRDSGINTGLITADGARRLDDSGAVLYRGWIVSTQEYAQMLEAVNARGQEMVTSVDEYERGQFIDRWYEYFTDLTPHTRFFAPDVADEELLAIDSDGPFVIKDASKSFKHDWDKACYVPTREDLPRVIEGFRELSDGMITRALIIREFEEWENGQNRLWWVNGELAAESAHPDTPDVLKTFTPEQIAQVQAAVAELGCAFVTTDVVRHSDGSIRVVEVGDGQVSDLPDIAVLTAVLNKMKEL